MPLSVLISDGDPSDAFFHQFSTIIRLESRLQGDHSEDVTGPARQRWAVRHLTEVAQAQGVTSQLPAHASTLNVHAREFRTPPPAQATTSNRSERITPWYENFNLADQGVPSSILSRPASPYNPFDPAELAAYRAVIRAQLLESSNPRAARQQSAPSEHFDQISDSFQRADHNVPLTQPPSTPPNNLPRVRYPSTPPNRPLRHRRHTSSTDSLPELLANSTLRASTEPIAQPTRMGSLTASGHYKALEVYALEVQIGDYIQSVKYPGKVMDNYPCEELDDQPIEENEARPVNTNGRLRIQFKGADGTICTKVFKGLDKVQVLREVAKADEVEVEVKKEVE